MDPEPLPGDRAFDGEFSFSEVKFRGPMAEHTPHVLEASVATKRRDIYQEEVFEEKRSMNEVMRADVLNDDD